MQKNKLNNKGITLVSLIVTIAVLVILASIGVASLTGDTSMIAHAENAKNATELGEHNAMSKVNDILSYANNLGINGGAHTHKYTVTSETPATCTQTGQRSAICDICGVTKNETLSTIAHTWDSGVITKIPSGTENGERTYTCTVCGSTRIQTIKNNAEDNNGDNNEDNNKEYLVDKVEIGDYVDIGIDYSNQETFDSGYVSNTYESTGMTGWRVLSKTGSGSTGTVTLVSAGVPLKYYHPSGVVSESIDILSLLNTSFAKVNENEMGFVASGFEDNTFDLANLLSSNSNINASTAHAITTSEVLETYAELTGTSTTMLELMDTEALSTWKMKNKNSSMSTKVYDLLGNGLRWWICGVDDYDDGALLYSNGHNTVNSQSNASYGVRVVVSLRTRVMIAEDNEGTGANENDAYTLAEERDTYSELYLANMAEIGDFVNYDPTTGGNVNSTNTTYTSVTGSTESHGNGYGSQTFSASNYKNAGGKWRILEKNTDGTITLISDPIYQDSGNTMGTEGFCLNGALGYIWAEEELHRISSIYGHGYGADLNQIVEYYYGGPNDQNGSIPTNTIEFQQGRKANTSLGSGARSLTLSDISRICDKDYTENYFNSIVEKNENIAKYYPTLSGNSATGQSAEQTTFSGNYYDTSYGFTISTAISDISAQTILNEMLVNRYGGWLASRCLDVSNAGVGYAYFGVCVFEKDVGYNRMCDTSSGVWSTFDRREPVRALVTLKAGIQTSDASYNSNTGWNLK